jgi:acyl-CoA reductase-like NAD-dependent aldehyde dehydrogenase
MEEMPRADAEPRALLGGKLVAADSGRTFANVNFYSPDLPFGGYKQSGLGRQNGAAGFGQYLETKSLAWPAG